MKKILTDEELLDVQEKYDDNLSEFKKKFILFFIGLCCFAVSIIILRMRGCKDSNLCKNH